MQTQSIQAELRDFVQFASRRVESGDSPLSLEELVRQWRLDTEYSQTVADVKQGIMDVAEGNVQSLADALASIRQKLGIED